MAEDRSQRTEKPTGRRIQKARSQGNVFRSTEVSGLATLLGFLAFAKLLGPSWLDRMKAMIVDSLAGLAVPDLTDARVAALTVSTLGTLGIALAGPLGMTAVASLAGNALQGRAPIQFKKLSPDFKKLNPVGGLKRVLSLGSLVEVVKALLKMVLYGFVAYTAARDAVLDAQAGGPGAEGTLKALLSLAFTIFFRVAMLAAFLSVVDYLVQRYRWYRGLMMTKKEIKDEHKETEGDPMIRARIRSKQMQMSRSRMMADVPKASVVVTNPTHYAVALRYEPGETEVPQVLAKGREKLAARIREIALAQGIPIVQDPPLARSLYKSVPVGGEIPPALFRAVAEVLALVLSRKKRAAAASRPDEARP